MNTKKMVASTDAMCLSNPDLLTKIDKLRDLNIGQHVPLPQVRLLTYLPARLPSLVTYWLGHGCAYT